MHSATPHRSWPAYASLCPSQPPLCFDPDPALLRPAPPARLFLECNCFSGVSSEWFHPPPTANPCVQPGGDFYTATVGPGSVIFIPASFVVLQQPTGTEMTYGWCVQCIEDAQVISKLSRLSGHLQGDSKSQTLFECIASSIAKHGTREDMSGS